MKKQQQVSQQNTNEKLGLKSETLRRMGAPLTEEELKAVAGAQRAPTHSQGTCP